MGIFSSIFGRNNIKVTRDKLGNFSYFPNVDAFNDDKSFLDWSLTNPVLMTVIALRSKLISQMQIQHLNSKGDVIEYSPELKLLNKPNYFQSKQDFLFQLAWYLSAEGENYTYEIKRFQSELPTNLYNLIPTQLDWCETQKLNYFIKNDKEWKDFSKKKVKYTLDNKEHNIEIGSLVPFYDLANNVSPDQWMHSPSRVQSIVKTLQNIEENLKSKNVNLKMSQKYLASNKSSSEGTPMIQADDKKEIHKQIGRKSLLISNANVDVTHLVSDMKKLYLDEQFSNDSLTVLLAFEGNKDILNYSSSSGSTYENQEQGIIRYVQNSIQSTADNILDSFALSWGLNERGETLKASFNHLPVMQTVMRTKIETFKTYQEALRLGVDAQTLTASEAKEMSDKLKTDLGL